MTLFDKPIGDISEDDLQALVDNQTQEQKTLEFKGELPGGSDFAKKDFLADVSSFANAAGGCLVYGIQQSKGENGRIDLVGIEIADPDALILQLTQIINSGIQPRIIGLTLGCLDLKNGRRALVIRIPQSYVGPHMITLQNSTRFCGRHSNGKYNLDVQEIRQAFLLSATVAERIRNFRLERIARIGAGELPIGLRNDKVKLVIHILPFASFSTNPAIDIAKVGDQAHSIFKEAFARKYNIDGVLAYYGVDNGTARKYFQVFRNGCVEFVAGDLARPMDGGGVLFGSQVAESEILTACEQSLSFQKSFGIETPIFIMITLMGVRNIGFAISMMRHWETPLFDRDVILIPETTFNSYPENAEDFMTLMKPVLDAMWNAAGLQGSDSFDENGVWIGHRR